MKRTKRPSMPPNKPKRVAPPGMSRAETASKGMSIFRGYDWHYWAPTIWNVEKGTARMSDNAAAKLIGCCQATVAKKRHRFGITGYRQRRTISNSRYVPRNITLDDIR